MSRFAVCGSRGLLRDAVPILARQGWQVERWGLDGVAVFTRPRTLGWLLRDLLGCRCWADIKISVRRWRGE